MTVEDGNGLQIECEARGDSDVFEAAIEIIGVADPTPAIPAGDPHGADQGTRATRALRITGDRTGGYRFDIHSPGSHRLDIIGAGGSTAYSREGSGRRTYLWKSAASVSSGVYVVRVSGPGMEYRERLVIGR